MKVKGVAFEIGRIALVEYENGQKEISILIDDNVKDKSLENPNNWAGVLCALTDLAVSEIPDRNQIEFEKKLLDIFNKNVKKREFLVIKGDLKTKEIV